MDKLSTNAPTFVPKFRRQPIQPSRETVVPPKPDVKKLISMYDASRDVISLIHQSINEFHEIIRRDHATSGFDGANITSMSRAILYACRGSSSWNELYQSYIKGSLRDPIAIKFFLNVIDNLIKAAVAYHDILQQDKYASVRNIRIPVFRGCRRQFTATQGNHKFTELTSTAIVHFISRDSFLSIKDPTLLVINISLNDYVIPICNICKELCDDLVFESEILLLPGTSYDVMNIEIPPKIVIECTDSYVDTIFSLELHDALNKLLAPHTEKFIASLDMCSTLQSFIPDNEFETMYDTISTKIHRFFPFIDDVVSIVPQRFVSVEQYIGDMKLKIITTYRGQIIPFHNGIKIVTIEYGHSPINDVKKLFAIQQGGYHDKYLKYKQKYLLLKK